MKSPIFVRGQKVVVCASKNRSLIGISCEILEINNPKTCIWEGKKNESFIYTLSHEGIFYGAEESQLKPYQETHMSCGRTLNDLMNDINEMLK